MKDPPNALSVLIYSSRLEDARNIERHFSIKGMKVHTVVNLANAKRDMQKIDFDCCYIRVTDKQCDGMKLLRWVKDTVIGVRKYCVLNTRDCEVFNFVYKLGVDDCFYFDSLNIDALALSIDKLYRENTCQKWHHRNSPAFDACTNKIRIESKSDSALLLIGPHGVGKSCVARVIHNESKYNQGKFVIAECCHYHDDQECITALRGKEAPTRNPIYRCHHGLVANANNGTLYVHEVSMLSPRSQEVLATLIQRRIYLPHSVGKEVPFNGKIIMSTTYDLSILVGEGLFSRRLYDCIMGNVAVVPTLMECHDDIIPLAKAFLSQNCFKLGKPVPKLSKGAMTKLSAHSWPGNVRELYVLMESLANSIDDSVIRKDDFVLTVPPCTCLVRDRKDVADDAIKRAGGNKSEAARSLGIGRTSIYRWAETVPEDDDAKIV